MKYKTTAKAIRNSGDIVKRAGYCELYYLLSNHEPVAFTRGVYGWNFDVYEVYGLTICMGYRGMPGARLAHTTTYEDKARAIRENYSLDYKARCDMIEELLREFCIANGGRI